MYQTNKSLLVRADFVLGRERGGDRLAYRRWRRVLIDALPRLLGCAHRCERAERARLHRGEGEGSFTVWLRLPIERRPSRRRMRKFKARLRGRLEAALQPLGGQVLKLGVRRLRARPAVVPVLPHEGAPQETAAQQTAA